MASRKALDIDAARADQRSGALPTVIKTYRLSSPREAVNTSADSPPGLQPAFCACPNGFRQQAVFSLGGLGRRELAVLFEFHLGCMIATPMASVAFRVSGHLMNLWRPAGVCFVCPGPIARPSGSAARPRAGPPARLVRSGPNHPPSGFRRIRGPFPGAWRRHPAGRDLGADRDIEGRSGFRFCGLSPGHRCERACRK